MKLKSLFVLTALILAHVLPATSRPNQSSNVLMMPEGASARARQQPIAAASEASSVRTVLGYPISVQASGRGRPWINFGDGHELVGSYSGETSVIGEMQAGRVRPLSLTAADLDGDGVPDLLSGFADQSGGVISVYRGNVDSIYPNSPEALERKSNGAFTDAPFLSPARLFEVPSAPDFIETGDFNADGFMDVAIASRGSSRLYVLNGDGSGGLDGARSVELPGVVTAMASGDVNRRDGLTDLVVGVTGDAGQKLLVFEGPEGALKSTPEVISLPGEGAAISVGYLYNNMYADIAVVAGKYLVTVHGRDRRLSMSAAIRAEVAPAMVSKLAMPAMPRSIAIGKFSGSQSSETAILMEDGRIEMAGVGDAQSVKLRALKIRSVAQGGAGIETRLMRAKVSGRAGDDLILVDQAAGRLRILIGADSPAVNSGAQAVASDAAPIDLAVDTPIAVLPMRLNVSARNDLVVLRRGHLNASIVPAQFDSVFTVTTTGDDDDSEAVQDDGTTLRDTLNAAANAEHGTSNEIAFAIPQGGVPTMEIDDALPRLPSGSTLTIDGTTQAQIEGAAMVAINGGGHPGLVVQGFNDVVRGLDIRNTGGPIEVTESNNIVEGNFIGTMPDGVTASPDGGSGVVITHGSANIIGGTAAAASNVIGASNIDGITITNNASGNMVLGNFVGVDQTRSVSLANKGNGIQVNGGASATTLGGPTSPNYFDANTLNGITISSGTNHLILNNASQANSGNGMSISGATSTTIGGTEGANLGNGFWQNSQNGLVIGSGATGIQAQGNAIGVAFSNGTPAPFPNTLDGVSISASSNLIGGDQVSLGNSIGFNGGDGVAVVSGSGNGILSNVIAANSPGLPIHLSPGTNDNAQPPLISGAAIVTAASAAAGSIQSAAAVQGASPVLVISFAFKSTPNQTFNMQFYVPQICNCTNCFTSVGIYTTQVTTDANGNAPPSVSITLTATPAPGSFINGTATNAGDSTSEFSECIEVGSASACEYTLSAASQDISASGGPGSFMVTTSATCPYLPSDSDSFVHLTSGAGLGNGTVTFNLDANPGTSSRTSTISIASGVNFTVIEDGIGPDFLVGIAPGMISGTPGSVIPLTVSVNRSGGFTGAVTVMPPAKANGIKFKPATAKKLKGSSSSFTLNVKIGASAVPGTDHFTFSATGAGLTGSRTATLAVTVQ
jgi:hypothetical protein